MNIRESSIIKSNGFRFDPSSGYLTFDGRQVSLPPVNTKVLLCLLESSPTVVSRNEIFSYAWPNQEISDDALTKCISEVRQAISKISDKQYIKTHPKKGYSWVQIPAIDKSFEHSSTRLTTEKKSVVKSIPLVLLGALISVLILTSVMVNSILNRPEIIEILPIRYQHAYQQIDMARLQSQLTSNLIQTKRFQVRTHLANTAYEQKLSAFKPKTLWYITGSISSIENIERLTLEIISNETHTTVYSASFEYKQGELDIRNVTNKVSDSFRQL